MPKRKSSKDSDYDVILKKVRKLEKKLRKKRHRRRTLSNLSTSPDSSNDRNMSEHVLDDIPGQATAEPVTDFNDYEYDEGPIQLEPLSQSQLPEVAICASPAQAPPETVVPPELAAPPPIADEPAPAPAPAPLLLDPEILNLLGEDPTCKRSYGANLHKDIAPRWTYILINGLPKETQSDLVKQYLPPENCSNMVAPKLNPEIKAALTDLTTKQDLYSQGKQNQLGSSLAALGQVINWALASKDIVPQEVLKALSDAGRLICDSYYRESLSRRYAVLNVLNRNIRDTVKETNIDENLFGSNLSDHIKSTKAITKAGSEMRPASRPLYRPPTSVQPQRGALNLRGAPRPAALERSAPSTRRPLPPPLPPPSTRDRRQSAPRGRNRPLNNQRYQYQNKGR